MISKNSYLKLSKLNIKRRIPYFVIAFLVCFLLMPVVAYFQCISETRYGITPDELINVHLIFAGTIANEGYLQDAIACGLALLFAVTGNAWNNSQKKNDFYKSLPVKEKTRFIYIHANSLIGFIVCFGINLLLINVVIACFGLYQQVYLLAALYSLLIHTLEFAAVYMLAVIAQYLTGNSVLALVGTVVLGGVEPLMRFVLCEFMEANYKTYLQITFDYLSIIYDSLSSPVAGAVFAHRSIEKCGYDFYLASNYSGIWPGVIKLLIQIVIYFAIAMYIYNRRPAQGGNKNIVFDNTKPIIKCLIMIPIVSMAVLFICCYVDGLAVQVFIGLAIALIVLHIVLQFAIEGDFAAIKKGLKSSACAGGIVVLIILFFSINGERYDSYLPDRADIESIGICTGNEYDFNFYKDDQYHSYMSSSEYFLNEVKYSDDGFVSKVYDTISKDIADGTYRYDDEWTENTACWYVDISFNLKNGKKVQREYIIPVGDFKMIKYEINNLDEYKKASNQIEYATNKALIESAKKLDVVYYNYGFSNNDYCSIEKRAEQDEILAAYTKDYNHRDASVYRDEVPVGYIYVFAQTTEGMYPTFNLIIYQSDANVVELLRKQGFEIHGLDIAQIEKIEINRYDYSVSDGYDKKSTVTINSSDAIFDEIKDKIYPYEAVWRGQIVGTAYDDYDILAYTAGGNCYSIAIISEDHIEALDNILRQRQ